MLFILVASCNKDKRVSKKLKKGEKWEVKAITIDGEQLDQNGVWTVSQDVNIYDSIPSIIWSDINEMASFQWQFREKAKVFEISYQSETCENCPNAPQDLELQCYFLSGIYNVTKQSRKEMCFESNETNGYPNKTIAINIERID